MNCLSASKLQPGAPPLLLAMERSRSVDLTSFEDLVSSVDLTDSEEAVSLVDLMSAVDSEYSVNVASAANLASPAMPFVSHGFRRYASGSTQRVAIPRQ